MWVIYALVAGIASAIGSLFAKRAAADISDSWLRSFYFSLFGTIIVLPFFIWEFSLPQTLLEAALILVAGVVIVASNYCSFRSYNYLSTSTISVIFKLKFVWILLFGILALKQVLSAKNIIGIIVILGASMVIADFRHWKSNRTGVVMSALATIGSTIYAILLTILTKTIGPLSLLFYVCVIPMLLNALLIPHLFEKTKKTWRNTKFILFNGFFAMFMNLAYILAFKEEFTRFFFLTEVSMIIILAGEYVWLKDRTNLPLKLTAVALAIAGAILIR